jgi:peptidoglycan/LPS O-acetylase OafA/YrhL
MRSGYLPTLDGWRAIAIAGVLLDHATVEIFRNSSAHSFLRTGPNGVSVFFAVSGFLICSRLLEEKQLTGTISLKGFYLRRACRILPAAFAYLAVVGALGVFGVLTVTPLEWASCFLFFRNYLSPDWIRAGWGGYTIHYWSLAVEEHFYLLWPALLAFFGRVRAGYVAAILAVTVAVWRWWDFHHHWMDRYDPGLLFGTRTDVRLDGLLLGCLAALILAEPTVARMDRAALYGAGVVDVYRCVCVVSAAAAKAQLQHLGIRTVGRPGRGDSVASWGRGGTVAGKPPN